MLCDILLCTPEAKFAQPEITLGIIPGAGGTQRLTTLIGKARAMDMVLTGRRITGVEAAQWGLVSRLTKEGESVVEEAIKVADAVAGFSVIASQAGKEAVNGGESESGVTNLSPRTPSRTRSSSRATTLPAALRNAGSERGCACLFEKSAE